MEGLQSSFLYESQSQVYGLHLWQPAMASLLPQPITLCPPAGQRPCKVTAGAAGVSGLRALAALQQLLAGGSSGGVTARLSSGTLGGPAGSRACSTAAAAAAVSGVMKVAAVEMPAAAWNTVDVDAAASGRQVRPSATTLTRKGARSSCADSALTATPSSSSPPYVFHCPASCFPGCFASCGMLNNVASCGPYRL